MCGSDTLIRERIAGHHAAPAAEPTMATSKKRMIAEEFALAQAYWEQAMMHRRNARGQHPVKRPATYLRAHDAIDSARYHLAQCGALLGLCNWPK